MPSQSQATKVIELHLTLVQLYIYLLLYLLSDRLPVWYQYSDAMKDPAPIASKSAEGLIPVHGGYRKLKSFQVAQLCFDVTVRFCDRYVDRRERTHDQNGASCAQRRTKYR